MTPPPWQLAGWRNGSLDWDALPASPAMIVFFQTHCQGCIHLALPQAEQIYREFSPRGLLVAAIHSSFEDRPPDDLAAFLSQGNYTLPVAVDAPGDGWKPRTMEAWGVEGTPTLVLLDKRRQLRLRKLGHIEDARLRAAIEQLLAE